MIKVIIYDDQTSIRDAVKMLLSLESSIEVVGSFANCLNIDSQIKKIDPDLVLMDIDMPEINGIEGVKKVKNINPHIQIIMLTVFDDDDKIFRSIQAGANGYLLKKSISEELIPAVLNSSNGGSSISPSVASKVLEAFRLKNKKNNEIYNLSKKEHQVLEQLAQGLSYKQIADINFVSVETIRSHVKNIYLKLHVNSATEAVVKALKNNIIQIDDF